MQLKNLFQLGALAAIILFAASCQKAEETGTFYPRQDVTAQEKRAAEDLMENLPEFVFWNPETNEAYKFDINNRNFSFATPNDGWNYSGTEEIIYVEDEGLVVITVPSFGANTGGTIIAGSSALDVDYTFCFSASDEALGLDLFDFGGELSGVSVVLGIAGDFEALMEGEVDEDADFFDIFHGFAMYVVYADTAQGTYEILNWLDEIDEEPDNLADKGFSYVIDFAGEGLYFSSDGTLTVSGGSVTFNGEYLAITDFLLDFGDDDDDLSFGYVSGYGTLGCN